MAASTSLTLVDRLTGPLTKMMRTMDRTISIMERMDRAAGSVDTRGLQRARRDIQNASADLERLRSSTRATDELSNGFNRIRSPVVSATGAVRNFFASFAGAAAAYLSLQGLANGVKSFIGSSDAYTSTTARLANINDGLQTQAELQDKIYNAAQRSLTPYNDLAGSVAKLNLLAGDAFTGGNDEAIRFSELMSKSFAVSGASTQEKQAGMYQLTQAMAAGKLQGDEFRSITENAPMLAKAISKSMGVSMGALKEMSSEGAITADIIKTSLFEAATDIEGKFNSMPLTFGDAMVKMKNWSGRAFEPLFVRFSQFVNSDAFRVLSGHAMVFINLFIAGMSLAFDAIENVYSVVGAIGQFFSNTWSVTGPILITMGVVLGSILAILIGKYTVLGLIRTATLAWAAAQWVVNAAYLANPITWVLLAVVAVIALIIYSMVTWADQTATVIGFIVGLFATLGTFIWNTIANIWNIISIVAEFLWNAFIDPTYAVKKLIYDMTKNSINVMSALAGSFDTAANVLAKVFVSAANIAIGAVNGISNAIKNITGIDLGEAKKLEVEATTSFLSDGLKNLANNLEAPTSDRSVANFAKMELKSMPAAFQTGNDFGKKMSLGASDKLTRMIDKVKGLAGGKDNPFSPDNSLSGDLMASPGMTNPLGDGKLKGGKLDKIGKIDKEIDIPDEDIQMLRDLAEIKSIQNFVTLTPQVTFGDLTIREEVDADKVVKKITTQFAEDMARSAEGVYT